MLALRLRATERASRPRTTATTTADAAAPRIILPDNSAIIVEVASDDATREQGLMYRDHLADDRGMIFLFPQAGEYPFWMKNTLIPLDMIWIDADHRIVHIAHDVPPCKADPVRTTRRTRRPPRCWSSRPEWRRSITWPTEMCCGSRGWIRSSSGKRCNDSRVVNPYQSSREC